MAKYYVNNNQATNPGLHHEVHKDGCDKMPSDKNYLGEYSHCKPAVEEAKKQYTDADGCRICSKDCNTDY